MGLVPRSYCEFTDSNWVWLRAYLVLQFPDMFKVGTKVDYVQLNGHGFVLQTALTNKWAWLSVSL